MDGAAGGVVGEHAAGELVEAGALGLVAERLEQPPPEACRRAPRARRRRRARRRPRTRSGPSTGSRARSRPPRRPPSRPGTGVRPRATHAPRRPRAGASRTSPAGPRSPRCRSPPRRRRRIRLRAGSITARSWVRSLQHVGRSRGAGGCPGTCAGELHGSARRRVDRVARPRGRTAPGQSGRSWPRLVHAGCAPPAASTSGAATPIAAWVAGAGAGGLASARAGDAVRVLLLRRRLPDCSLLAGTIVAEGAGELLVGAALLARGRRAPASGRSSARPGCSGSCAPRRPRR